MRFPQAVYGQLVSLASESRETLTDSIVQVERIPEDREWNLSILQER